MKKIIVLAAFLPMFMISCGGGEPKDSNEEIEIIDTEELDFSEMNEISLKPNGLNLKLMLPSVQSSTGSSIDSKIDHDEGDYLWYIHIGPHFQLVIEDFGKEKNKITQEKKRLAELDMIFDVEFFMDEPNLIMYRRSLHEGQGGKISYHCYGEIEIDGYNYVLRSEEEGALKPIIEDMVKTIRSAKPISVAS